MQITRGITGIWQISQNKNVSNAVPLKIRFFIPPTAYGMHHLPLAYSVQDFETYSGVTAGGSSHTHDVTLPDHTHSVTTNPHTHDVTIPAHDHTTTIWDYNPSVDSFAIAAQVRSNKITLSLPEEYPDGTDLDLVNSTKDASVESSTSDGGESLTTAGGGGTTKSSTPDATHTHPITANLDTVAADCNDIAVSVDGVNKTAELEAKYGALPTTDAQDLDLFGYLSSPVLNAWHEVIITPNGVGTPAGMCYMYAYLSPETVVKEV